MRDFEHGRSFRLVLTVETVLTCWTLPIELLARKCLPNRMGTVLGAYFRSTRSTLRIENVVVLVKGMPPMSRYYGDVSHRE